MTYPFTIGFIFGAFVGICLVLALLKWGERKLDREDDKDRGITHD